jgi:type III restriction enzyme
LEVPLQDENGALTDDQSGYQRSVLVWDRLKDKGLINTDGTVTSK